MMMIVVAGGGGDGGGSGEVGDGDRFGGYGNHDGCCGVLVVDVLKKMRTLVKITASPAVVCQARGESRA